MDDIKREAWLTEFSTWVSCHSRTLFAFKKIVGVHPVTVDKIWYKYLVASANWSQRDLLWTLSFLSRYCTNDMVMACVWGVSENAFMDRVWLLLEFLYTNLKEVK